jgi:hypothetical protein
MDGGAGTVGHPQPQHVRLTGQQGTSSFRHPLAVAKPVAPNRRSCRCEVELDPTMVDTCLDIDPPLRTNQPPRLPSLLLRKKNASTLAVVGATGAVGSAAGAGSA